jgi:hypothetical protein
MKIILDTNVILDTLSAREPHKIHSDMIFGLIGQKKITGYMLTSSVTDVGTWGRNSRSIYYNDIILPPALF